MGKKHKLPEGHERFEFKAGREGFEWQGMRTEGDPSSNRNNQPRMLVNLRWDGGGYRDRGGLTRFNSTVLDSATACIKSLVDLPIASPVKLWVVGDGCPGTSSSVGFYVGALDPEQEPEFSTFYYYSAATTSVAIGEFDDYIYILVDSALRRSNLVLSSWGVNPLPIGGAGTDLPLVSYSGFTGKWLQKFDDKLFVLLGAASGTSKIATWDGVTSLPTERTSLEIPSCAALYRIQDGGDALAVGYSTGNLISLRTTGSAGTWTDFVPGAGTVTAVRMLSYKDVLWITNGDENLFKLEAGTLSRVQPATTGIAAASVTRGLAVLDGVLYMGYTTAAGAARIASFDGTTWTAIVKNITTQFATVNALKDLASYRGHLVAACTTAAAGGKLYSALTAGLTGAWIEITPAATANGDIDQLLVS